MAEKQIFALMVAFSFVTLLLILGMPEDYSIISGFDFLWFGGGIIAITTGCVVITGVPCAIITASYGIATMLQYVGIPIFLSTGMDGALSIIKAVVLTPITILITYIMMKLARGGG